MCRARGCSAFSLAELIVAMLILSVMSVVLVGVIPASITGIRSAGERATAAMLARSELEKARQRGLSQLTSGPLPSVRVNRVEYTLQLTVQDAVGSDGQPLPPKLARDLMVTVRWKSRTGPKTLTSRAVVTALP
ncbi:MAG: type II secretion system protein [Candidatus Eremiobacterota bacterium]